MEITLSIDNHADELKLPVLPSEISISTGLNNTTLEVVNLGEIGIIGNNKLKTVSLSSFFPLYYASYCETSEFLSPYEAVAKLEKWRDSRKPIRLNISATPVNMACMIEEFTYREKGGQPGVVYYDLSLKEYRFINMRTLTADETGKLGLSSIRPVERATAKTYTVKKGDSLYVIAKQQYGDGNKYKQLYEKNKAVIGPNPNLILPGQVLTL